MFEVNKKLRIQDLLCFLISKGLISITVGLIGALLAIKNPLYFGAFFVSIIVGICFFIYAEQTVITLLILRSGLDAFSDKGLPAIFAIGLNILALSYIAVLYLTKQKIYTDKFWWIFAGWVALQGLWPILTAVGGLDLGSVFLAESIREWIRIFSWLLVYLLISQLKGRLHPEQIVNSLFLALVIPLFAATLQLTIPIYFLPDFLQSTSSEAHEVASRINGTLGHPNTFTSFLILFISLTYWKMGQAKQPLLWGILLMVEIFFLVSTKAIVGLPMLAVLLLTLIIPRLNFKNLIGAVFIFAMLVTLFTSTEFGRERLASVFETPIFNPNMTIDRAILLSWQDGNSFNWRLAQWTFLIDEWKQSPLLGYGLGLAKHLGPIKSFAHNDYVRILVENGLIGLFLFLVFYLSQFVILSRSYLLSRNHSHKQFCLSLIAIFLATLTGMITENIWSHTAFFMYWWTLFSIVGWNWSRPQEP